MPSALNRTISARQTCLCGALRSRASAARRRRSLGLRVMEIPVRMRQNSHATSAEGIPPADLNVRDLISLGSGTYNTIHALLVLSL